MTATVANVRSYRGDMRNAVYCGRPSPYGNPFVVGTRNPQWTAANRREAISLFRNWFLADAQQPLRERAVRECTGKVLLCWCHPLPCHVDVIAEYVNYMWQHSFGPMVPPRACAES